MKIQDFISKYEHCSISDFGYSEILSDLHNSIIDIPFPLVSLYGKELVERIRNNYNGEIFTNEKEVSLRTDIENITEFGRVNKPHHSNFYGTLADNNLDLARITTVIETHRTLRTQNICTTEQQIFTTSQWLVEGNLKLLVIPFHSQARRNKRLEEHAQHFTSAISMDFGELSTEILKLLAFFSDHFGREVDNHSNYKLTAAFGEVFMQNYQIDGIIYPSVKSEFQTQNIVLSRRAVYKLKLHKVGMFELFIHKDQVLIDPLAYAEDLGPNNSKFNWIPVERTPKEIIDYILGKN